MSSFSRISSITGISSIAASAGGGGGGGGVGDVIPNAVNWTNITYIESSDSAGIATQQITGIDSSINISPTWTMVSGGDIGLWYRIRDDSWAGYTYGISYAANGFTAMAASGQSISVANNKWLAFMFGGSVNTNGTVTVLNASDSNTTLDTFTVTFQAGGGCVLTTAVVGYMGLSDDGPELTAMRALRSHYIGVAGYTEIIAEYTQTSPQIISAIETANAESTEYTYIYNTVVSVMGHVNAEEWQQAHDLYMAMYEDLKSRYLGA